VPTPLAHPVRVASPQHHGDGGEEIGDRREKTHGERPKPETADDLGYPESYAVEPGYHEKIQSPERQHARAGQGVAQIRVSERFGRLGFAFKGV